MRIILTRHGETEENKQGILQGHRPGKLSALGERQAELLAEGLKHEHIEHIYSSDLNRASSTARIIAKYHGHVPLLFTKDLRERNLGSLEGKTKEQLGLKKGKSGATILDAEDAETRKELFERANRFIHTLLRKHPNETVLLVGHNAINKAIVAAIIGNSEKEIVKLPNFDNTSITIFEIDEDRNHKIQLYNSTTHLEGQAKDKNND